MLSETIALKWKEKIFDHATIRAITDKALPYELLEESEFEIETCSYKTEINFFEYVVSREYNFPEISGGLMPEYIFQAEIRYTREKDTKGLNYQKARSALESMQDLVLTELGDDWDGLVDFWLPQGSTSDITQRVLAENTDCWNWVYRYTANLKS